MKQVINSLYLRNIAPEGLTYRRFRESVSCLDFIQISSTATEKLRVYYIGNGKMFNYNKSSNHWFLWFHSRTHKFK